MGMSLDTLCSNNQTANRALDSITGMGMSFNTLCSVFCPVSDFEVGTRPQEAWRKWDSPNLNSGTRLLLQVHSSLWAHINNWCSKSPGFSSPDESSPWAQRSPRWPRAAAPVRGLLVEGWTLRVVRTSALLPPLCPVSPLPWHTAPSEPPSRWHAPSVQINQ